MTKANPEILSNPTRLGLKWKFGAITLLVIILISGILFPIIYSQYKYQRLAELNKRMLDIVETVIALHDPITAKQQFIDSLTKIKANTDLRSLVVFDSHHHVIAHYGEDITLTPQLMHHLTLATTPILIDKHNQFYSYWTSETLHKSFEIIAKINGAPYIRSMWWLIAEYSLISLAIAFILIAISLFISRIAENKYKTMALFPSENHNPIIRISANGKLRYANLGSITILQQWQIEIGEFVPDKWRKLVSDTLQLKELKVIEEQFASKIYMINIVPINEMNYVNLYFTDISRLKEYQQQLRKTTSYDSATNLPNRRLFIELLTQEMQHIKSDNQYLLIFFFGISDFKNISLYIGHDNCEALLLLLVKRLQEKLEQLPIIARINEGNFAAISEVVDNPDVANLIAQNIIETFYKPFKVNDQTIKLTANIGIAIYPSDGKVASELLKHADLAMYHARTLNDNNYQFYISEMNQRVQHQTKIIADLHAAIDEKQFLLYFQPQHDLKDNTMIGAEVLLRWQHPEYGLMTPSSFINTLETSGMIHEVGQWILTSVCEQIFDWKAKGLVNIRFAINISPKQFNQQKIIPFTNHLLTKTGIDPALLEYEITEGITIDDTDLAIKIMDQLHDLGIKIAIDDFGTGYSSLKYLHKFPVQRLKIDKSFIHGFGQNGFYQSLIKTIISLGHILGMKVIAEGVETKTQYDFLAANGCDEAQGYYFAKPLPKDEFFEYASKVIA